MKTDEIEAQLLSRFKRCAPRDRVIIRKTAELARRLETLDAEMRADGCDGEMTALHREMLTALGDILHRLGAEYVHSTEAASILGRGYATAAAAFGALPSVGHA
jgi:hypothetical protein